MLQACPPIQLIEVVKSLSEYERDPWYIYSLLANYVNVRMMNSQVIYKLIPESFFKKFWCEATQWYSM